MSGPGPWWNTGAGLAALLGGGVLLVAALVWDAVWFNAARAGQVANSGGTTAVDSYGLGLVVLVLASAGYLALVAAVIVERVRRRRDQGSSGAGEVG